MRIRSYQARDLPELRRMTVEGFDGIAIDQSIERQFGIIGEHDWRWRKARHVDQDVAAHAAGVFVAVDAADHPLGYISTRIDREASRGHIPNLAVDSTARSQGIGRRLVEHALEYFRSEGVAFAVIETMANNPIGQHLYPSCGFVEVGRQVIFAQKL